MTSPNGSILVVDDDADTASALAALLRARGYDVDHATSGEQCLDVLASSAVDVVMSDVHMNGMSGLDLCRRLRETYPELLPIMITGQGSMASVIEAIRAGAYDYVLKPVNVDAVELALSRALEHLALRREVSRLRNAATRDNTFEGIAGESPAIRDTIALIERIAPSDATVLVTGESGTGKELVSRALHHLSPRRDQPFVAVNCAAMPAALFESELFGHVRGAFTDARHSRPGMMVQAGAGTLYLDEISEMTPDMQVKLLRVLQERRLRPVGSDSEVPFDARVITSTNRELEFEVAEKRFREDLFYRINVVEIAVPPLRARGSDVLTIAYRLLARIATRLGKPLRGISPPAARLMMQYDWPGNVRELENCIERAASLCRLDHITIEDLPEKLLRYSSSQLMVDTSSPLELVTLAEMERRYVRRVLQAVDGNKSAAARVLGIDRRSLYRRLEMPANEPAAPQPELFKCT